MGNLIRQTRAELKQLPLMLGKLLGGGLAVGGFGATVWVNTHGTVATLGNSWLPLLVGTGGIVIFVLSDRRMAARPSVSAPTPAESKRINGLAWSLLLLLVAVFLLCIAIFLR